MGNSSAASFIRIPGNIKQSLVPFAVDPGAPINATKTASPDLAGAKPQIFSFKPSNSTQKINRLNICPTSFFKYMQDDISYKLLYQRNIADGKMLPSSIDPTNILENVPAIQIREFLPDTALDQAINFVTSLFQVVDELKVAVKNKNDASATKDTQQEMKNGKPDNLKKTSDHGNSVFKAAAWTLKYMFGATKPNLLTDISKKVKNQATAFYGGGDENIRNYVINFPYVMYYRFLSSVTTNIYELPCIISGNTMYMSNGAPGWKAGDLSLLYGPLALFPLFKTFFGNIRIHFMKTWDATEGSETSPDAVTVTFDLFNDTDEAAISNFIFVNTLIANNKWVQYNIFEHAPALYDIKIEGYERLFACSGKFKVSGKGVMRNIPNALAEKLDKYKTSFSTISPTIMIKQHLIKIPDVYTVEMIFLSVLPDNFNTWLFKYSLNKNQIEEYTKAYQDSIVTEMLGEAIKSFAKEFKNRWPNGFDS